ncbi:hypothetical protein ACROYT_G022495 [Oculina patagonica]
MRPWSFSASITSTFLGFSLAWKETRNIDAIQALLTTVTVLFIHSAGNLVNTYYDFANGFDTEDSDDKTLVKKELSPNEIAACIAELYFLGIVSFVAVYLRADVGSAPLLAMFFSGVLSSFFYTGGIGLKYMALGDVLILLTFGVLTTVFAYFIQTGEISMNIIGYALPLALNTEAILHGNNTRDLESDRSAGGITLAILLGKQYACVLYCLLLMVPYAMLSILALSSSWILLVPLVTLPLAVRLSSECFRGDLVMITQKTAQLNLLFGLLYMAALTVA